MCMRFVNAATICYKNVIIENSNIVSFDAPFSSIQSTNSGHSKVIGNFSMVTKIDFLGTENQEHKSQNPLEMKKKIDFIIRLTKCDYLEENRIGYDIDKFTIDLNDMYEKGQVDTACFDYFNYTRITNIEKLDLPGGAGKYVIKILIKNSEDSEYSIQSMTKLMVT